MDKQLEIVGNKHLNDLEKGGKRAVIGEIRKFGGRDFIKTADGWKFHGKGTGKKAQSHKAGTNTNEDLEKKTSSTNRKKLPTWTRSEVISNLKELKKMPPVSVKEGETLGDKLSEFDKHFGEMNHQHRALGFEISGDAKNGDKLKINPSYMFAHDTDLMKNEVLPTLKKLLGDSLTISSVKGSLSKPYYHIEQKKSAHYDDVSSEKKEESKPSVDKHPKQVPNDTEKILSNNGQAFSQEDYDATDEETLKKLLRSVKTFKQTALQMNPKLSSDKNSGGTASFDHAMERIEAALSKKGKEKKSAHYDDVRSDKEEEGHSLTKKQKDQVKEFIEKIDKAYSKVSESFNDMSNDQKYGSMQRRLERLGEDINDPSWIEVMDAVIDQYKKRTPPLSEGLQTVLKNSPRYNAIVKKIQTDKDVRSIVEKVIADVDKHYGSNSIDLELSEKEGKLKIGIVPIVGYASSDEIADRKWDRVEKNIGHITKLSTDKITVSFGTVGSVSGAEGYYLRYEHLKEIVSKSKNQKIEKSEEVDILANKHLTDLEKGGKKAQIGEERTFGNSNYIKTATGWKYKGKGGEKKTQKKLPFKGEVDTWSEDSGEISVFLKDGSLKTFSDSDMPGPEFADLREALSTIKEPYDDKNETTPSSQRSNSSKKDNKPTPFILERERQEERIKGIVNGWVDKYTSKVSDKEYNKYPITVDDIKKDVWNAIWKKYPWGSDISAITQKDVDELAKIAVKTPDKYFDKKNNQSRSEKSNSQEILANHILNDLEKGKPAQEGEERTWGGKKYKKTQGKWVEVTKGRGEKKEEEPKGKSAKKPEEKPKEGKKEEDNKSGNKADGEVKAKGQLTPKYKSALKNVKSLFEEGNSTKLVEAIDELPEELQTAIPEEVWDMYHAHDEEADQEITEDDWNDATGGDDKEEEENSETGGYDPKVFEFARKQWAENLVAEVDDMDEFVVDIGMMTEEEAEDDFVAEDDVTDYLSKLSWKEMIDVIGDEESLKELMDKAAEDYDSEDVTETGLSEGESDSLEGSIEGALTELIDTISSKGLEKTLKKKMKQINTWSQAAAFESLIRDKTSDLNRNHPKAEGLEFKDLYKMQQKAIADVLPKAIIAPSTSPDAAKQYLSVLAESMSSKDFPKLDLDTISEKYSLTDEQKEEFQRYPSSYGEISPYKVSSYLSREKTEVPELQEDDFRQQLTSDDLKELIQTIGEESLIEKLRKFNEN